MATISYVLRDAYATNYLGAVISVGGSRTYNVGQGLIDGGGSVSGSGAIVGGTITIDAADQPLVDALDNYAGVRRSGSSDVGVAAATTRTGSLIVSRREPVGSTVGYVPALQTDGSWVATAPSSLVGSGSPVAGQVQIADNCYAWSDPTAQTLGTPGTFECFYAVGIAASDIRLVFGNWRIPAATPLIDADGTATVQIKASIKQQSTGKIYRVTFNGSQTGNIEAGATLISDIVGLDLAVGETITVRIYVASGTYYTNRLTVNQTSYGGFATTDLTAPGSGAVANAGGNAFAPMAIIGTPTTTTGSATPKAVLLQGDSIGFGAQDGQIPGFSGYYPTKPWMAGGGFLMRALSGFAGVISICRAADQLQWFLTNDGHYRRMSMARYARFAILQYGTNDLGAGGRTAAQLQADIVTQALLNARRGITKTWLTTILPAATSTDKFATVGNQTTQANNAVRVTHNNWVRAGCPINSTTLAPVAVGTSGALLAGQPGHPIAGFFETADPVESARDSGLWRAADRVLTDGAGTSGTFAVTSATAAFTNADKGKDVLLVGGGVGGVDLLTQIDNITNSTTATTRVAPSTTVSGATLIIGPASSDGVHPLVLANKQAATGIDPTRLV